jgi:hypothetical protein
MRNWKNMIIPLDQVHPHWRIDTRQVSVQTTMNDSDDKMKKKTARRSLQKVSRVAYGVMNY